MIPEDWGVYRLGDLCTKSIRYGIVQPGQYDDQGRFMLRGQDYSLAKGWAKPSDIFRVSKDVEEKYANARVSQGDVVMTIVGYCGHVEIIPDWLDGANLTQTTARISTDGKLVDPKFMKNELRSQRVQKQVDENTKGAAQPGLNCSDVSDFHVVLPPLKEQHAIAEVLSDVDAEIESLARRHEKLISQKQGLSEELLSGRTRLVEPKSKRFKQTGVGVIPEDWEWCPLGDVALVRKGELIRRADGEEGSVPVISAGKRPSFFHSKSNRTGPVVTISASGANAGYVGLHEGEIFAADCSSVEAESDITTRFLGCYLQHKQQDIYSLQEGGAQPHVQPPDIIRIPVVVPPVLEQKLIVVLLGDVDAEIQAVAKLKAKVQAKKEGLIQTLLTGKIRLT